MLKGYRTIIVNVLTAVAVIITQLVASPGTIPENFMAIAVLVLAVVNAALRFITTAPIGSKH